MHRFASIIQKFFGAVWGMRLIISKRVAHSSDTVEQIIAETISRLEEIQRKQDSVMMNLRDLIESQKGIEDARAHLDDI